MRLIWSDDDDAQYVGGRSRRYPDPVDIEPEWAQEVVDDEHCVAPAPYPRSRVRATGYVGYSPSAGRVLGAPVGAGIPALVC